MSSSEQRQAATTAKWLSVVGIGEDGVDGMSLRARELVSQAEFVFGGRRHLVLAEPLISGEARAWPIPFDARMSEVRALRGRRVCVLASGDPLQHGVGATLARLAAVDEMEIVPAPSAFSLAAARLGWSLPDIETVSLHGKPISLLRPLLHPARRVLALTSDENGPSAIARLLRETGFGQSTLTVLEALGGRSERVTRQCAEEFDLSAVSPLNLVAIEIVATEQAQILPLTPGLADDLFEHDGQITKCEIRAVTLAALAPLRGELLWDIGGGSGSVCIEWLLRHPSMRAIAIEADPERAARIARNAEKLGISGLKVVEGRAPEALADLPPPDAIFVGGGGSVPGVMDGAIAALRPHGRLVANAVTLEMEAVLLDLYARLGGTLIRLAIQRAEPVGAMSGWRPAMPVTQWRWRKSSGALA